VAHEFFHSWNVRRIRPQSLEPFDFDRVNMSGELWFAEGFTSYYGVLALKRAGFSSLEQFANEMGRAVTPVLNSPGRLINSPVQMSRLAPFVDAARSVDETNFVNTFISYYTYGEALALGLDLSIRSRFPGKSLDSWMRDTWRAHPDIEKPYTLKDLEWTLAQTTGDQAFAQEFFEQHVQGRQPMDYGILLRQAGLMLRKQFPQAAWIGEAKLDFANESAGINSNTLRETPLYRAGLDRGDRILRWDNKVLKNAADLVSWLAKHKPGEGVTLQVRKRDGEEMRVTLILEENPTLEIVTFESIGQGVETSMLQFRRDWLDSKVAGQLQPPTSRILK